MAPRSYGLLEADQALNLKQWNFWVRDSGNNDSDCCRNDPRTPNIYVSNCSCHFPSTALSLVQDSMPLIFLCELKQIAKVSSHISSHMVNTLEKFLYYTTLCNHGISFMVRNKL